MSDSVQQSSEIRKVTITCFTCQKETTVALKAWQLDKKIECPTCQGKEVVIGSTFFKNL